MNNAVYDWQALNMAAKIPFMSDGQFAMPLVVRIPAHRINGMDVLVDAQAQLDCHRQGAVLI